MTNKCPHCNSSRIELKGERQTCLKCGYINDPNFTVKVKQVDNVDAAIDEAMNGLRGTPFVVEKSVHDIFQDIEKNPPLTAEQLSKANTEIHMNKKNKFKGHENFGKGKK